MAVKQQRKSSSSAAPSRGATPVAPEAQPLSSDRIALRAFEIWQESGCPHGQHEEHWYRAERELRAGASR